MQDINTAFASVLYPWRMTSETQPSRAPYQSFAQALPTYHPLTTQSGDSYDVSRPSIMSYNSAGQQNVLSGFSFGYHQDGARSDYRVGVGFDGKISIDERNQAGRYQPVEKPTTDLLRTILDIAENPGFKALGRKNGQDMSTDALRGGLINQYRDQFPPERLNDTRRRRVEAPAHSAPAPIPA